MGLFDKFKKEKEEKKEKERKIVISAPDDENVEAVGWEAIEKEFLRVYPDQDNPKHYGTLVKWIFGGKDPLDGISVYDGGDY